MTTIATRVLLVDDDEDLRHAHLQTLRLAEAPARGFAGGEDALRHIDRAFAGVVTRAWSPASAPAKRTPGVTVRNAGPHRPCTAAASSGEHTTPSSPAAWAFSA